MVVERRLVVVPGEPEYIVRVRGTKCITVMVVHATDRAGICLIRTGMLVELE